MPGFDSAGGWTGYDRDASLKIGIIFLNFFRLVNDMC